MIIKKLSEICTIRTGKHDANHAVKGGKYRFYTCSSQFSYCDTKSFEGESIIVPGNGDIGLVFYYNGEFDAYQRTYVLSDIKINAKFLYYHMLLKWRYVNDRKKYGSTVKYVRMANFTSYEIPVSSSDEQERIVAKIEELFSQLDAGVAELQAAKKRLKVYRQAVLKEAFEDIQNIVPFGEIMESRLGKMLDKQKNKGIPRKYLRNINVRWFSFDLSDLLKMRIDEDEIEKYSIHKGDLVICEGGEPGRCAVWMEDEPIFYQKALHRIRFTVLAEPKFYMYYLWFAAQTGQLQKYFTGTGIKHLTGQSLVKIPVPFTDIRTQREILSIIESRLSVCDSIEKTIDTALQQAEALRQSILKQAFEGKL
jgi:type I restriction enzyme S subunit